MKKTGLNIASALMTGLLISACSTSHNVDIRPVAMPHSASVPVQKPGPYEAGKSYLAARDYSRAIDAFRTSIALDERKVEALNGLAITYDMLDRFDISSSYYEKALSLAPNSPVTLSNYAKSMHMQGNDEEAARLEYLAKGISEVKTLEPLALKPAIITPVISKKTPVVARTATETTTVTYASNNPDTRQVQIMEEPSEVKVTSDSDPVTPVTPAPVITSGNYRILNGTGRLFMGSRIADFMEDRALPIEEVANADNFDYKKSVIRFAKGYQEEADHMASLLPAPVHKEEADDIHSVDLIVGQDFLSFDTTLLGEFTPNYNM